MLPMPHPQSCLLHQDRFPRSPYPRPAVCPHTLPEWHQHTRRWHRSSYSRRPVHQPWAEDRLRQLLLRLSRPLLPLLWLEPWHATVATERGRTRTAHCRVQHSTLRLRHQRMQQPTRHRVPIRTSTWRAFAKHNRRPRLRLRRAWQRQSPRRTACLPSARPGTTRCLRVHPSWPLRSSSLGCLAISSMGQREGTAPKQSRAQRLPRALTRRGTRRPSDLRSRWLVKVCAP